MQKPRSIIAALFSTMALSAMYASTSAQADVIIKPVAPFEPFTDSVTDFVDKSEFLIDFENNSSGYSYTKNESISSYSDFTALDGEQQFVGFSISNQTNEVKSYDVYIDLPPSWEPTIRRRVLLNDFYKAPLAYDYVLLFGDAIPLLIKIDGKYQLTLNPKETARLLVDFKTDIASLTSSYYKTKTTIHLDDKLNAAKKWSKVINMNLYNVPYPTQDTICFNSIAYNTDNSNAGMQRSDFWETTGFSSLTLTTPINTSSLGVFFDEFGDPVDASGNPAIITLDLACRSKISNWVLKNNKEILIFWEPYYNNLAKKTDGTYLPKFSSAWNKALSNLMGAVYNYSKSLKAETDSSNIVLYAYDEIHSENYYGPIDSEVEGVVNMLQDLKEYVPSFRKMISYTSFSFVKDVRATVNYIDIACVSLVIKNQLTGSNSFGAPLSYNPQIAFRDSIYPMIEVRKSTDSLQLQNYLVCQGKTESTNSFRIAPIVNQHLSRSGLSWYGFQKGGSSTWLATDGNALDYSLAYEREAGNALNDFWNQELEYIVPSIRTKAITASKQDVEIYSYIKSNYTYLSLGQKNSFDSVQNLLETYLDSDYSFLLKPTKSMDVASYENKVSKPLRRIFASYHGVTSTYTGTSSRENPVGINFSSTTKPHVEVYPNPFTKGISIEVGNANNSETYIVGICDITGMEIYSVKGSLARINGELRTVGDKLLPGIYVLNIQSGLEKLTKTFKIIKQ